MTVFQAVLLGCESNARRNFRSTKIQYLRTEKRRMAKESKATGIKTWPEDDRPREKLLKRGAGALSNSELLAILLRTGTNGTSAIDLARKVLKKFGSFRNMAHTDSRDWKDLKGLGGTKIAHIQAALGLGRRYREDIVNRVPP